jgi:phosphoglycerate dehydrogenase-like enzyme
MTRNSLTRLAVATGFLTARVMVCAASAAAAQPAAPQLDVATVVKEYQLVESSKPARELVPGWTPPKKLLVLVDKPDRTAWLQQAMPKGVEVIGVRSEAEAAPYLVDADATVMLPCRPTLAAKAPKMKWLHMGSGGSDQCLAIPGVAQGRILMTNGQKVKNTVLAEMAMGYVLALARSIDVGVQNQQLKELSAAHGRPAKQLEGATMLVVGLGGAGTEIARIAHSLGMNVIATRNSSHDGPDFVSYVGLADETPKLVSQADVVVICAPLTPATRGLFNTAMFSRMKKDAMLINWTRAEITVPDDLAAALKAGTIGSAALNWATAEPLPKDHPLWTAPNLILAPWAGTGGGAEANKANQSETTVEMRWVAIRENMRRFATGDKMYSVFDLERGY